MSAIKSEMAEFQISLQNKTCNGENEENSYRWLSANSKEGVAASFQMYLCQLYKYFWLHIPFEKTETWEAE